ncbi:1007_t:CDS:10, partial [Entrophospora sp. SA101]
IDTCLKAIGFVSNELISALNDKNLNIGINLGILFEQIIHQILNEPGFPFLRGRAFVFASQFASVLPGELTSGFIKAAIEAIKDPDGTIPVKVSALRALKSFCRNLNEQYVLPFQGTIIECVANLINVTTEDFLLLVLETLERAIKINRDVIFQYEGLIGPMVVDVWQKFPSEHLVMSAVNSISETLSINSTFIERALPALANIIMNPTIDSSHTESAIDLITSLIRGTTISPLPFVYIQHIFPPLIHLMLTTEERSILQSGEICLRYLVQKGCSQISEWTDNIGKSGLSYLIDYIAKSLQPIEGESAAFLGDLVVILIKKAGDKLNPVLPDLLKAVALKLDSAKTTTSIQVLLHKWLEHHDSFTGYYNCKVSSVALTKLFSCGDPRISAIQVKGDLKESNATVLPGELTSGFIKAAIEAIKDPDGTIPVKVSALRALKSFCRNLNEQYVLPFQGTIIECVANLINVTTEDFLLLVLETLERAIKINRDVIFQYEGLIGPMVVDVWQKFPSEHLVMSAVNSISETLSINSTFIERALPALANIIMNPTIDSSHTESAIDLITSLIRGTTISPLPFVYIQHIFPPLIHLMLTTEERSILQSGEICLRYLVQKGCSQISEWTDNIGKSGLSYLIDYIAKSLQPIEGESAAFLGDLVVILIKKAGDKLNPVLPDLLKAVALKLDSAKTTTSIQVLLHKWLEHHDSFTGYYNCKVSSVALTKLFSCGDPRISAIQVKGDLKESNATGIKTRSKSRQS